MKKTLQTQNREILEKVKEIVEKVRDLPETNHEQAETIKELVAMFDRFEQRQFELEESLSIFKFGHEAIKKKHIDDYKGNGKLHEIDFQHKMFYDIREDSDLKRTEKEVLEFLAKQFDAGQHRFKEIKYKQLKNSVQVAEKTLLKALKALLEQEKVVKRSEGKDAYYKVNYQAYT